MAVSQEMMMTYRAIPALAVYIDRIGAEELNFKRFMIKDYRGAYYKQRVLITINNEREIVCSHPDYAPTEAEAAAIKLALTNVDFPRSVQVSDAKLPALRALITESNPTLYEFYARPSGNIIMVQQRCERTDGTKYFKSWSYWSDEQWRAMEPDGNLPFWKPKRATNKSRIMIHEGAKAAKHVNALREHPWMAFLQEFEHWGMIGGALSPHRADYQELRDFNPAEVIYVCDNDMQGKEALQIVSYWWKRGLKGVYFDDTWPSGWDMADPVPASFFKDGKYIGPMIERMLQSATWATDVQRDGKRGGKSGVNIRPDFAEEWLHCTVPEVYVHRDKPQRIIEEKVFNNQVRPFSDVKETSDVLKKHNPNKTGILQYLPYAPSGFKSDSSADIVYVNTHVGSWVKPVVGDPGPWLDFMGHLIEDEHDLKETLRWIATLVARPEIKILYGMLLISETQGVGKGTLGERILVPLLGKHNVSIPSEGDVVDSNFNYWAAHKRLAIIHEIYSGHSSKAYNKLKSVITDRYITVNKKYQASYEIDNWLHVYACSNSPRALKLSIDDRRWFVPKVGDDKRDVAYWDAFNKWLTERDGLGIIKHWCSEWIAMHAPVLAGASAPMTAAKRDMVEEAYSPGQELVAQFLRTAAEKFSGRHVIMLDGDLQRLIQDHIYEGRQNDRLERTSTIRKVAKSTGWHVGKDYVRLEAWGTRTKRVKVITNHQAWADMDPALLTQEPTLERVDVAAQARSWFFAQQ